MTPNDLISEAHSLLECVFSERPAPVEAVEHWLAEFEQRIIQGLSDRFLVLSEFEEKDMKRSERLSIVSKELNLYAQSLSNEPEQGKWRNVSEKEKMS